MLVCNSRHASARVVWSVGVQQSCVFLPNAPVVCLVCFVQGVARACVLCEPV
jgi:hypothetical protein